VRPAHIPYAGAHMIDPRLANIFRWLTLSATDPER
jgi:hypothetical protein